MSLITFRVVRSCLVLAFTFLICLRRVFRLLLRLALFGLLVLLLLVLRLCGPVRFHPVVLVLVVLLRRLLALLLCCPARFRPDVLVLVLAFLLLRILPVVTFLLCHPVQFLPVVLLRAVFLLRMFGPVLFLLCRFALNQFCLFFLCCFLLLSVFYCRLCLC